MPKVLLVKELSQRRFVYSYVVRMSAFLNLTKMELLILVLITWRFYILKHKGISEINRRIQVLSPDGRGEIREQIEKETKKSISIYNFNNYIKSLKDKGAIIQKGKNYDINSWFYPESQITFKYEVNEKLDKYLG